MAADGVEQFTYKGKTMGYKAWAKESGISEVTLRRRISKGMTMQQAIEAGTERKSWAKTYTFNGITDTLKGWAERVDINEGTLRRRLETKWRNPRDGDKIAWEFERAITEMPRQQWCNELKQTTELQDRTRAKLKEAIKQNNKGKSDSELGILIDTLLDLEGETDDSHAAFMKDLDEKLHT